MVFKSEQANNLFIHLIREIDMEAYCWDLFNLYINTLQGPQSHMRLFDVFAPFQSPIRAMVSPRFIRCCCAFLAISPSPEVIMLIAV